MNPVHLHIAAVTLDRPRRIGGGTIALITAALTSVVWLVLGATSCSLSL